MGRHISIHALLAESDVCLYRLSLITLPISIHALLAESDNSSYGALEGASISIHALLAESDDCEQYCTHARGISIHALLAESDGGACVRRLALSWISIHALLAESDIISIVLLIQPTRFLSTLSLRRATPRVLRQPTTGRFLSTLSLRRATYPKGYRWQNQRQFLSTLSLRRATISARRGASESIISIHALLAESDTLIWDVIAVITISIHALLAESDGCQRPCGHPTKDFYPRSPCGERPSMYIYGILYL